MFNKLITGGFRIGVSQKLMTRALAQATGQDTADLAHKLMGQWNPQMASWEDLILAQNASINLSRPYPFCLGHALDTESTKLGDISEWSAEWKWDGIRAQVVVREKNWFIWSRGEEMVNNQFPELASLTEQLPHGTVIDGELLAWADDKPLPFHHLQKRLGRKTVPASLLKSAPIRLLAYDLLEEKGSVYAHNPSRSVGLRWRRFCKRIMRGMLSSLHAHFQQRAGGIWQHIGPTRDLRLRKV